MATGWDDLDLRGGDGSYTASISLSWELAVVPQGGIVAAQSGKGTSELLGGAVTLNATHIFHIGVDGSGLRTTDGYGIVAGPSGQRSCPARRGLGHTAVMLLHLTCSPIDPRRGGCAG